MLNRAFAYIVLLRLTDGRGLEKRSLQTECENIDVSFCCFVLSPTLLLMPVYEMLRLLLFDDRHKLLQATQKNGDAEQIERKIYEKAIADYPQPNQKVKQKRLLN